MNLLIGFAALVGFVISLVVHVAALRGIDVIAYWPSVWSLHFGVFVVFTPLVFSSRKTFGAKLKMSELRAAFPSWVIAVGMAIFAYAAINFSLFLLATEGGNPEFRDGKYVLLSHGTLIRELTIAEYASFRSNEIRGFSGHWLVFYFVSFAYFIFRKNSDPAAPSDSAPAALGR